MIYAVLTIVCLVALLIMVILFGVGIVKNLKLKNQSLRTEICTMSNTFREKGIEETRLKKEIKDLEKENKNLRRNK